MTRARNRVLDCVLVWKFDRFARSTRHLLTALEEFDHLGVRFINLQDQIDTASPMRRAMFSVIGAMAELESSLSGLLPYSPEASEALLEVLKEMSGKKRSRKKLILNDDTLRLATPLFTHAWLFDTLPKTLGEFQPAGCNSDGCDIVFHELRFPLETDIAEKDIAERFVGIADLRQENPTFWNWLGRPPAKGSTKLGHPDALVAGVTMEDGTPVLGNLEVKGRFLVLVVNSAQRAQRGGEMVQNILGNMVRTPLTSIQTIEQLMAAQQGRRSSADDIPPEVATPLVHAMLDRQYRATLDEPVGMLGDISPRAAARTKAGRLKVAEWLKYLEMRSSSGPDPNDPMATYDFGWIWKELEVEDLRR